MSFIKDVFFGGAEKKAAEAQAEALGQSQEFIKQGIEQARGAAIPLFNAAGQNVQQGFQGALDVFGQTIPQQFQAFQGGNVGAQEALLSGLGQQQAAILGQQLNPNALQAQTLNLPDFSTFQQQLPDFTSINQALGINQPPANTPTSTPFIPGQAADVGLPGVVGPGLFGHSSFENLLGRGGGGFNSLFNRPSRFGGLNSSLSIDPNIARSTF